MGKIFEGPKLTDHVFMSIALEEARLAYRQGEVPVGAVLVSEEARILARTCNAPIGSCDPTAHAEILALREGSRSVSNYRLTGATLYVTLEPCVMCLGAMVHARIRRLVFGASDSKAGVAGGAADLTRLPIFNHDIEVCGGVMAEESSELLKRFFRERRLKAKGSNCGEVPKRP